MALRRLLPAVCAGLFLTSLALLPADQKPPADKKKKGLPLKPERKVEFTTDEGTWLSLNVAPDGRQLVFGLLGDRYTLPIGGGEAKPLMTGMAFDSQPRFSPDGRRRTRAASNPASWRISWCWTRIRCRTSTIPPPSAM